MRSLVLFREATTRHLVAYNYERGIRSGIGARPTLHRLIPLTVNGFAWSWAWSESYAFLPRASILQLRYWLSRLAFVSLPA